MQRAADRLTERHQLGLGAVDGTRRHRIVGELGDRRRREQVRGHARGIGSRRGERVDRGLRDFRACVLADLVRLFLVERAGADQLLLEHEQRIVLLLVDELTVRAVLALVVGQ